MPSFDIVTEINIEEARNAADNAQRELSTRFDFRGVEASFEYVSESIKLTAEAEFQLEQMLDILRSKMAKRNLDPKAVKVGAFEHSGKTHKTTVTFVQGIDTAMAKKLTKLIKDSKLKVQASIQGEQVRVTGKKRDDLQQVMQLVRGAELEQPFQFTNFRD
ncbi:nucleotide-binding protein [Catenovulum agarivorans DS-2]|uniref:Nucleotide-binding protein DS2_14014 n=1 Tax=Catenovulum agarivorans DS-2 TaxID=1328313 RepID=W7QUY4_9ALTE|nr:YajQ family cyclic di-GMP-binding protein [Catenovulum agarivorans]EWH09095.1 nucleotide-binding protein [Catenovulum agarivorans DS-2]